jgi:hypothetical protein
MINTLQAIVHALFTGILNEASAAAMALFDASMLMALTFYIIYVINALFSGGGAEVLGEALIRILILLGLTALVVYWPAFVMAVSHDINAFGAQMAGVEPSGELTPDAIIATHNTLIADVMKAGSGHGFVLQLQMKLWKAVTVLCLFCSGTGLAFSLWFANISDDLIMAVCAVLMGFVINPWLRSYAMTYIGIITGTAIFIFMVGILVGTSQILGEIEIVLLNGAANGPGPGQVLGGPTMLEIGFIDLLFAILAWTVPIWISERIAGGPPIIQVAELFGGIAEGFRSVEAIVVRIARKVVEITSTLAGQPEVAAGASAGFSLYEYLEERKRKKVEELDREERERAARYNEAYDGPDDEDRDDGSSYGVKNSADGSTTFGPRVTPFNDGTSSNGRQDRTPQADSSMPKSTVTIDHDTGMVIDDDEPGANSGSSAPDETENTQSDADGGDGGGGGDAPAPVPEPPIPPVVP